MITVKTVMDNLSSEQKALKSEHGLCFYVETQRLKLLFDFGAGPAAYENLHKMNISLGEMTYAIGSHGHYDHAGGFETMAEMGLRCPLVTGKGYFDEKYAREHEKYTYLGAGFDETGLIRHSIEHQECEALLKLDQDCYVVGAFDHTHEFETVPERFVKLVGTQWQPDLFTDEICLALDTEDGVIVIVGCSHPGIMNILTTVEKRLGRPVCAVIGGTHLVEADEERISNTLEEMKRLGVRFLGLNHCSGKLVREMLEKEKQIESVYLGVGDCLFL